MQSGRAERSQCLLAAVLQFLPQLCGTLRQHHAQVPQAKVLSPEPERP